MHEWAVNINQMLGERGRDRERKMRLFGELIYVRKDTQAFERE